MEKVQERALRFVFNDKSSSYDTLLDKAGTSTLTLSRIKTIAAEVYKSQHMQSPVYVGDMFKPRQQTKHNLRQTGLLNLPPTRTVKYGKNSIHFEGAKIWNHLPQNIRCSENFSAFKRLLKTWNGCQCPICKL